jgi:hypothetical protein
LTASVVWFPSKDRLYASLEPVDPSREISQGDVFDAIPFARFRARSSEGPDVPRVKRGLGLLMPHPCDISPTEKGAKTPWRTLCRVAQDKEALVTIDGSGHFFAFPLPGLRGDESVWYADFRYTTVVDKQLLTPDRRVAALSIDGWLALQRRIAHFYSRGLLDVPYLALNAQHHPDGQAFEADGVGTYSSDFVAASRSA